MGPRTGSLLRPVARRSGSGGRAPQDRSRRDRELGQFRTEHHLECSQQRDGGHFRGEALGTYVGNWPVIVHGHGHGQGSRLHDSRFVALDGFGRRQRKGERGRGPHRAPRLQQRGWLWARAWVATDRAFWYENWAPDGNQAFPQKAGAPDLNLLIAPAFAWMYHQTGDTTYRDSGDQVFAGGVTGAYLDNGKQFNQNYMWSFDYVKWRSE